jgi:hypothetical protein
METAEFQVLSSYTHPQWNGAGPRDILARATSEMVGKFGTAEVEGAAWKLVRFLATFGPDWRSFTLRQAIGYYEAMGWNADLIFYGLSGAWSKSQMVGPPSMYEGRPYLVLDDGGEYAVTSLFVERCMAD